MIRKLVLLVISIMVASTVVGQELTGPSQVEPGTISVFAIEPAQEADWVVTPPDATIGSYTIDSGSSRLYFATPVVGDYAVIASVVIDGKPKALVATVRNGDPSKKKKDDEEKVEPDKKDETTTLADWVKTNVTLVESKNVEAEKEVVAGAFTETVEKMDRGTIKSASNAQTQLTVALTERLAKASDTALTEWSPFLSNLSEATGKFLGDKKGDMTAIKASYKDIATALTATIKAAPPATKEEAKPEPAKTEPAQKTKKMVCTPNGCYWVSE